MNLVDRTRNILISPKTEWPVINTENTPSSTMLFSYAIPLLAIGAIATFIGQGLIGINLGFYRTASVNVGLTSAALFFVFGIVNLFILSAVIDALAPSFSSEKNWDKSFQLAAYSMTAAYVGAFFLIYPPLSIIYFICALYCIYLLYTGIPVMKKTPADKQVSYLVVIIIVLLAVMIIIGVVQAAIIRSIFWSKYGY